MYVFVACLQALCVHPGMVLTEIGRGLPQFVQTAERIILGFILLTPMEGTDVRVCVCVCVCVKHSRMHADKHSPPLFSHSASC